MITIHLNKEIYCNAKARKEKKRLLNKKLSKMGRTANQVKKWKAKMKEQGIDIRNIRWT